MAYEHGRMDGRAEEREMRQPLMDSVRDGAWRDAIAAAATALDPLIEQDEGRIAWNCQHAVLACAPEPKAKPATTSNSVRMTDKELADAAAYWDSQPELVGWVNAPEAIPTFKQSTEIVVRFPTKLVRILEEFASRSKVPYLVLIKRWLDERVRHEAAVLMSEHLYPKPK
jgi:hypothetical protein